MKNILQSPKLKKLLIIVVLVVVAAVAGAYVYLNKDDKTSQNQATSQQDGSAETQQADLTEEQKSDLRKEYETHQEALEHADQLTAEQKPLQYMTLAFKGSRLYDDAAKEYAAKALESMPKEQLEDPNNAGLIADLKNIQNGEFDKYNKSVKYEDEVPEE